MDGYPQQWDLDREEQLTCQFDGCGKQYKKFRYLIDHLKNKHAIFAGDLADHWLRRACKREERKSGSISVQEMTHVDVSYDDLGAINENSFFCKACNSTFSKQSAFYHMTTAHGLEKKDVKTWLVVKDATLLKTSEMCTRFACQHKRTQQQRCSTCCQVPAPHHSCRG
jgi:hypothetical protein